MDPKQTIKVKIDVAGFYYRGTEIEIPVNSSVLDACNVARAEDVKNALAGNDNPVFDFSIEKAPPGGAKGFFINEISILHSKKPVSGQRKTAGKDTVGRQYEAGRYAYADDPVAIATVENEDKSATVTTVAVDEPTRLVRNDGVDLPYVLAWQYYLYDAQGRDLARRDEKTVRVIEPASTKKLEHDVTIVWRLIAIFLKPTEGVGMKGSKVLPY